ncbi:MAG: FMN-binding negative transcriptional regulator [Ectothiorhodospiraceae bacterium]|nr:FMN-binding negative transcriptional regulator [Ectothiorhodospiraceae bacterium]MCH8503481.1 FMN-binding negative transcriptional regulator [Ectothiorhodospiraceae bacterium]
MYLPRHFEETRTAVLHEVIRTHPFATLVTLGADGLDANHLPLILDSEPAPLGTLRGHVARANPVWRQLQVDARALLIFQGPHAYISPSWYATKQETGKVVPTWNYAVVHAHGSARVVEDADWLRNQVEQLTNTHEGPRPEPWQVSDAPQDYIEKMLKAIVGIEVPVARLAGKWKLGQNRSEADREGVLEGLQREQTDQASGMLGLTGNLLKGQ